MLPHRLLTLTNRKYKFPTMCHTMGPHSHSYAPLVICVQRTVQMFAAFQVAYRDSAHSAHSAQKRCMPPILSRLTTKTKTKTKTNASYQRMLSSLSVKIARFSLLTLAHSHSRLQLLFILFMLCALFVYVSLFVVGFLLHLAAVVCYRALQFSVFNSHVSHAREVIAKEAQWETRGEFQFCDYEAFKPFKRSRQTRNPQER